MNASVALLACIACFALAVTAAGHSSPSDNSVSPDFLNESLARAFFSILKFVWC